MTIPKMGTIIYDGGVLTTAVVERTPSQLRYEWTRNLGAVHPIAEATDWDHAPTEGVVTVTIDQLPAMGMTLTVTTTGTDLAGAAQNEALAFTDGDPLTKTTTASFGSITKVASLLDGGAANPNVTVGCNSGKIISNTGRKLSGVLTEMGNLGGVTVTTDDPQAGSLDAADADCTAGEVSVLASYEVRADSALIVRGLAASQLVEAARGASCEAMDLGVQLKGNFGGGSDTAPVGTAPWQAALDAILDKNIQIVIVLSTDTAVHALLAKHCNDAALQGYERNCWVGGVGSQTKAQVNTETAALNTRYVSAVFDQIEVDHPNGSTPTLEPSYFALICACMQAGSPVAWPLTHNRPRIRDAFQTWSPNLDADEMIAQGVCMLTQDTLGWRIERSVTTYRTDDNPILSETSAWESVQTCVRDLRSKLIGKVGNPGVAGTRGKVLSASLDRLDEQVKLGWIKAHQNVDVEDLGDRFRLTGEIAPVEPTNFFDIALSAVRIPG